MDVGQQRPLAVDHLPGTECEIRGGSDGKDGYENRSKPLSCKVIIRD